MPFCGDSKAWAASRIVGVRYATKLTAYRITKHVQVKRGAGTSVALAPPSRIGIEPLEQCGGSSSARPFSGKPFGHAGCNRIQGWRRSTPSRRSRFSAGSKLLFLSPRRQERQEIYNVSDCTVLILALRSLRLCESLIAPALKNPFYWH